MNKADRTDERARIRSLVTADSVRRWIVDINDGIIATAGIIEGFIGAGAGRSVILAAAFAAMVAGGVSLGGAKFTEAAAERDADLAAIDWERRQLEVDPDGELAELTMIYQAKGLSPGLAAQVAAELTDRDALAAHADAEHGIQLDALPSPMRMAAEGAAAFALGAAMPLSVIIFATSEVRAELTVILVLISLALTSTVGARLDRVSVWRTVLRVVAIGAVTMALTYFGGRLFDL